MWNNSDLIVFETTIDDGNSIRFRHGICVVIENTISYSSWWTYDVILISNKITIRNIDIIRPCERAEIIQKLKIFTNDYKVLESLETKRTSQRKNAKNSPIEVNFYTVDSIYGNPDKKMFHKNFIVSCQKNDEFAILELSSDEQFEFPSNGIFVIIKNLTQVEYDNLGFDFPPGITTIGVSKDNKIIPYFRYTYQEETALWSKYDYLIERQNAFKIGIEFKN